jgi:hypothetical protein
MTKKPKKTYKAKSSLIYQLVEKSSTMLTYFLETKRVLLSTTGENTKKYPKELNRRVV